MLQGPPPDGGASVAAKPKNKATPKGGAVSVNKSKPEPKKPEPKKPEVKAAEPAAAAPLGERRSKIPPKLTVRAPVGADELKAKIGALATATAQIRNLKRTLSRSFMDVGVILIDIRDKKLFEAKGYGSFEAFLEREIDLGKTTSLRLIRVVHTFHREAALELGMDRLFMALMAIEAGDTTPEARPSGKIPPPPLSSSVLPLKPPGR